jgi:hypothetical protein
VRLQNLTARPLTDLPISVGLRGPGNRKTYLNRTAGIAYYDTHIPALAANATADWVLPIPRTAAKRLTKATGRPFADVGFASEPPSTQVAQLPQIAVRQRDTNGLARLRLRLANHSGLPQYGIQVYAVATHEGRYVAAGRASIDDLGAGASSTVRLTLLGKPRRGSVQLSAPPTIFK